VTVSVRSSTELSYGELAALFTAAYEGYFVPFTVDEATFGFMVEVFDLDLSESLVAHDDHGPVGLANLGRRGRRTWLGGVGVVGERRRQGIGELLTRELVERARALCAEEMVLEVIVENRAAIRLYERLGFVRTRELEVLSLTSSEAGTVDTEDVPLSAARAIVRERREEDEPWQRDDDTVDRLAAREPPLQGVVAGDAAAVYRVAAPSVSLVQAAGSALGLRAILSALGAKGTVSAVNYPPGGAVASALRAAGADVTLRQYEMVKRLD
jgi:GNAT superfamily N-acetyltransferase